MKRSYLFAILLSISIFSCKKDNKLPKESDGREPEAIITSITEGLKTADSISNFIASLKTVSLTEEETTHGITVFAPLNANNSAMLTSSIASSRTKTGIAPIAETRPQVQGDPVLKDHIVKGIIALTDLTDNKILTSLSGKQLKVTKSNNTTWINGVQIGGKQILSTSNEIVYTVKSSLTGTDVSDDPRAQEFFAAFKEQGNKIGIWHKNLVVADALLSHQAPVDSIPMALRGLYQTFSIYQFQPNNAGIYKIWQEGYQHIAALGNLIEFAPANLSNRAVSIGQLRALRAYIYLQLLSYYGNVPLVSQSGTLNNSNRTTIYNFVVNELRSAAAALPSGSSSKFHMNATTAKALEAKAALLDKNYSRVDELATAIINGGSYALASNATKFSNSSAETLWSDSLTLSADIKSFFMNRETLPYIRLTEVYMMGIEAALGLGQITKAQNLYSALLNRSGATPSEVSLTKLRQLWQAEMRREGHAFVNMIRWNTAADELAKYGYATRHSRLPIPQIIITENPNMMQNPGY